MNNFCYILHWPY